MFCGYEWVSDSSREQGIRRRQMEGDQHAPGCPAFHRYLSKTQSQTAPGYCDGSGMDVTMCDALDEEFGQVHRVLNGAGAEDDAYSNRGSEIWFTAKRAIEDGHIVLPGDPEFFTEATDRQIHYDAGQYLLAEPKKAMKKRGVHSPDVADAVLAAIVCGPQNFAVSPKAQARQAKVL
jgi:hypothetical protein